MTILDEPAVWSSDDDFGAPAQFAPPPLPPHLVHRDRLDRQVSLAVENRLTVVTGPPGSGKTVLLGDWARRRPSGSVAWLTVEEADNDPRRFCANIAGALGVQSGDQRAGRRAGLQLNCDLHIGGGEERLVWCQPRVLVVDDFHLIHNEMALRSVAELVDDPPSNLRFVLVGQNVPAFPLQGPLAHWGATRLIDSNLRFTVEESAALIALAAGKCIPRDELQLLNERTEGWAAGLYLAALALGGHEDPSTVIRDFSGVFGPVAEYLEHEVLLRQTPNVVRFLLQTSVLDNLYPEVCQAVTGRGDAGEVLKSLAEDNLFVAPAGPGDRTYRYHCLFADLLRSRLKREDPAVTRNAHFDAANWFEQAGDFRSAAHHLVQAQAYGQALLLLFSNLVEASGTGLLGDIAAAVPEGPQPEIERDPSQIYITAAAQLARLNVAEAARLLQHLDVVAGEGLSGRLWRARAAFLWALHADGIADPSSVLEHAKAARDLLGSNAEAISGRYEADEPDGSWLGTVDSAIGAHLPLLVARSQVWLGQLDEAQANLAGHFVSNDIAEASEPSTLAILAARQGRLSDAYRLATAALQRAETAGACSLTTFDARLVLAEVLFEHNELDMAQAQLETALQLCRPAGATHRAWAAEADLMRVMIAQGRPSHALNRLGHLRQLGLRDPPPHHLLQKFNELEIGCRLCLGDLEGALMVARSARPGDISNEVLARIDLASGRPDRALARLNTRRSDVLASEIRRLVLLACTESQHGRALQADEAIRKAVDAARPEGYVRPFLEGAPQVLPFLRLIYASRPDPYLTLLIEHAERLAPGTGPVGSKTMLEPLTVREREVLGYLSSHLTGPEIAARMYLSPNTAKCHQKAIYRKLGASSRANAVAIAVSCGLL
jgi:LuxR family transcriptional regulator, maltose regulon positive regulatory protein